MSPGDDRSRPGQGSGSEKVKQATSTIVAPHADTYGLTREQSRVLHRWIADANDTPRDRLALVAVVETTAGTYRRRVFLTLEAAHRALNRAAERGLSARVVLCELVPITGGERE